MIFSYRNKSLKVSMFAKKVLGDFAKNWFGKKNSVAAIYNVV